MQNRTSKIAPEENFAYSRVADRNLRQNEGLSGANGARGEVGSWWIGVVNRFSLAAGCNFASKNRR
jgi:hypothetical protein